MLKLQDNPTMLPPGVCRVAELSGTWAVVQTKARAEKALAWAIQASPAAAGYFLPMIRRVSFSGGRKRVGFHPAFAGYVFVNETDPTWRFGAASRHIARVIKVNEQSSLVAELGEIERALDAGTAARLLPHLVPGRRYRVRGGPLDGVCGTLVRIDDVAHVVLNITVLGQSAAMPVEATLLEPLEE